MKLVEYCILCLFLAGIGLWLNLAVNDYMKPLNESSLLEFEPYKKMHDGMLRY